jgi:hypothetical protein
VNPAQQATAAFSVSPDGPVTSKNLSQKFLKSVPTAIGGSNTMPRDEGSGAALNQGGRNENVSNNLLDPSGHLRTFVAWLGS